MTDIRTVIRKPSTHPADLTSELVAAEQKYAAVRNSVIERASSRIGSIREIKAELNNEETQLHEVVAAAQPKA